VAEDGTGATYGAQCNVWQQTHLHSFSGDGHGVVGGDRWAVMRRLEQRAFLAHQTSEVVSLGDGVAGPHTAPAFTSASVALCPSPAPSYGWCPPCCELPSRARPATLTAAVSYLCYSLQCLPILRIRPGASLHCGPTTTHPFLLSMLGQNSERWACCIALLLFAWCIFVLQYIKRYRYLSAAQRRRRHHHCITELVAASLTMLVDEKRKNA